jgi:hypothetical protein
MRATHGFDLARIWRNLAVASVLMLLATSMVAGSVLAGNTSKQVYFGSGPFPASSFGFPDNYSLSFTPVSGGRVTSAYVTIQNKGGGTLNHVILEGGTHAPSPRANTNFIPDGTNGSPRICEPGITTCLPSLPSGFTYVAAFAPTGRPCTIYDPAGVPATTGPGIKCDVGQLPNNAAVTYRFAIQVPASNPDASTAYQTWFTASGNEGTSSKGSNQDAFFALGSITVDQTNPCSDANFFTSGTVTDLGTSTCDQPAKLTGGAFVGGAFAKVGVSTDPTLCLAAFKCFGKRVDANVEFGAPVDGGLQWTVLWQKSSLNGTPKGFIHFLDAYPTNPKAYEIIDFKSTAQCPATIVAATKLPCLKGKPGFVIMSGISYFQAIFTTTGNGQGRGY